MKIGFDHVKYLEEQSKYILERVNNYDKLYLEFGGKLMFDKHAARVLPGFDENAKIKLLHKLREKVEVVICVYAGDIERNKIRGDFGITYDMDVLRLIDDLRAYDLDVNSVVITRFNDQPATTVFINKLERRGIKVYKHRATKGYPTDVDTIVSDEGYGKNPYIETTKPIVVVTAPGPGSGKLATCLSQLYHEFKRGNTAGYSKFETFPVWNVPLKHPLNIAYEAATVDLKDVNMIDDFGITYDMDVLRLIDDLRAYDLDVNSVVITRFNDQPATTVFINKLERRGIKVYKHRATKGYPTDVDTIVSDEGYGKNPYIETTKPIVVVTAPGPGSGKLATCLSQLYHEFKRGNTAGYSKFETFPVWNVPLKHPLNIAYEAATVDLKDVNMIDSFHMDAYGE